MISANSPTSPILSTSIKSVSYPSLRPPPQKPNNKNSLHAKTQSLQECVHSRKVRTVSLASCFTPKTCSCKYKCVHDKRSQSAVGSSAQIFHENLHGEASALSTARQGRKEEEEWRGKPVAGLLGYNDWSPEYTCTSPIRCKSRVRGGVRRGR